MDGTHIAQFDSTTGLRLASNDSIDNIGYRCWAEEGPFIDPYVVNGTQYYSYFAPVNACRARVRGPALERFHNSHALCGAAKGAYFLMNRALDSCGSWVQQLWNRCSRLLRL